MPNLALYRKYRPVDFDEVSGQETITRILKNQIITDRIGHAYLLTGIRGTGKTTIAKIFARAVNCEHPVDGSPCGECATCKALLSPGNVDINEIDAASNRGVDEIRNLRETVTYAPTVGTYKVYIIDEVHMLTKEAFNALLKTLEEPPEHAIFVLATTEPAKLPQTILSRCQIFAVKPIDFDKITKRLEEVVNRENVEIEEDALKEIARRSGHAMRDALSLLDQCIDLRLPGETITKEDVSEFLGISPREDLEDILRALADSDSSQLLNILNRIRSGGKEDAMLLEDLSEMFKELLYYKLAGVTEEVNADFFAEIAPKYERARIYEIIDKLVEAHAKLRYNKLSQILTDTALLSLCKDAAGEVHVKHVAPEPKKTQTTSSKAAEPPSSKPVETHLEPIPEAAPQSPPEPEISDIPPALDPDTFEPSVPPVRETKPKISPKAFKEAAIQAAQNRNEILLSMLFENSEFKINKHGLFLLIEDEHAFMFETENFPQKLQGIVDSVMGEHTRVYPKLKRKYYERFGKKETAPTLEEQVRAVVGEDVIYEKAGES